jgi:hypothetical protein
MAIVARIVVQECDEFIQECDEFIAPAAVPIGWF